MEEFFLHLLHGYIDLIPGTIKEYQDGHWTMGTIFAVTAVGYSLIIWPIIFIAVRSIFSGKKPEKPPAIVKTPKQELREWAEMQYLMYRKIIPPYNREKYLRLAARPVLALPPAKVDWDCCPVHSGCSASW